MVPRQLYVVGQVDCEAQARKIRHCQLKLSDMAELVCGFNENVRAAVLRSHLGTADAAAEVFAQSVGEMRLKNRFNFV